MSEAMAALLDRLAEAVTALHPTRMICIAVDGVDGAGKTSLADSLAPIVAARGRPTVRASVDDFHRSRVDRYARGRDSPDGFYLDSYDYTAFRGLLLDPFRPGGSGRYVAKTFDTLTDQPRVADTRQAAPKSALIVDGIFLHRPELQPYWDLSIFLKVVFDVSVPRGAGRGPGFGSPDPQAPANRRYIDGQKRYFAECDPEQRADIVIDYNNLRAPGILRWNTSRG